MSRSLLLLALVAFVYCGELRAESEYLAEEYVVERGETFYKIATAFDLGVEEILRANPFIIDPNRIYAGNKITLPLSHLLPDAKHEGIVINLAEMRLYFFGGEEVESFPITIGKEGKTPTGKTKIFAKTENPTWIPPQSIREENPALPEIVPPGADNPLGNHALYLDGSRNFKWHNIIIHGTNTPWTIGSKVSHGCIRMYPQDVEKLFAEVEVGTVVRVVDQAVKVSELEDKIYLESHLNEAALTPVREGDYGKLICKKIKDCDKKINWDEVDEALTENLGIPIEVTLR